MVVIEKSFPRGGVANIQAKTDEKKSNIIFGASQKKLVTAKSKTREERSRVEEVDEQLKTFSAELLNYETIQDGMTIMGIVKSVEQLYLSISLPGRITARVSALDISDAYTKATREFLQNTDKTSIDSYKQLRDLYRIGQIVYGRVQEVTKQPNGRTIVNMTLKPSEVHTELQHTNVKKGFVFNGAIEEVQEHGYIIESGINNMRTFVPLEKAKTTEHSVGELIFLKVDKITHDKLASTCICKEVKPSNLKIKSQNEANIDYILPSSIVQFNVVKQMKDGLQGTIMNETFTAYVNEHQLSEALALPEDYEVKSTLSARVLYVMPLTKLVYLTLNLRQTDVTDDSEDQLLQPGEIIENAKVHRMGTGGVILVLKNKFKGVISYKTIKANYKGNYDQDDLLAKYAKKTNHKVRIIRYDVMDSLYICSDDTKIVNEKVFCLNDLQPGDFVTATVKDRIAQIGGYALQIGKVNGIIEQLFLAPNSKQLEIKTKLRCRIIAINMERHIVYLTNRSEYMAKNCKILTSLEAAKLNANYTGTIVKCNEGYLIIRFFNNVKGILYHENLKGYMANESSTFQAGQTMKFRIVSKNNDDEQLVLGLPEDTFSLGEICPIEVVNQLDSGLEITVTYADDDNEPEEFKGLVPTRLLSDFTDLLGARKRMLPVQTDTEAVALYKNIFSLRDVEYFRIHLTKDFKNVNVGDIMRAYVKNVNGDVVELMLPIRNYNKLIKLHLKMLRVNTYVNANIVLTPDQVVYVKILSKESSTKTLAVTAKLTDVWNGQLSETAEHLESYLKEVSDIKRKLKKLDDPIAKYNIGDKISAQFEGVNPDNNDWLYVVEGTKTLAVLRPSFYGRTKILPRVGDKQECIVLWIDYSNELLLISNKAADIAHITKSKKLPANYVGSSGINAKILLKLDNVVICSLKKGVNPLVYCPVRLHYNDFEETASAAMREGDLCKLTFIHTTKPIAVLESVWKLWKTIKRKADEDEVAFAKTVERKKVKLELSKASAATATLEADVIQLETNSVKLETNKKATKKIKQLVENVEHNEKTKKKKSKVANKVDAINDVNALAVKTETSDVERTIDKGTTKSKKRKQNVDSIADVCLKTPKVAAGTTEIEAMPALAFYEDKKPSKLSGKNRINSNAPKSSIEQKYLPGIADFWSTDLTQLQQTNNEQSVSSDEESDAGVIDDTSTAKQKRRLTATEKFKQQREEEARLREIETKYADPNHLPETIDQFDRLVLSEPNNSKNWINYMVFHLQATEIEKARAVARRAIKTITFRDSNELINVWVALLNLELRYGSKDIYDETLKEALLCNEPLKIYLRVVEILSEAQKTQELIDIVGIITKKFKSEQEVWRAAANAYFSINMVERAQQLLHRALACLPEREHVNTIVIFANLNHKHGHNDMAQTLLDQIVTSYPKRVDVWTQYVDLLIKCDLIDSARTVLERAVMQKIPLKKMRTIFKKYLDFEERFGNNTNVEKVKQLAQEYVKNNQNL